MSDYELIDIAGLFDLRDSRVVLATISTINAEQNTASIILESDCSQIAALDLSAVPFWYHCEYSTGTLEDLADGHKAFSMGDEVYVLYSPAAQGLSARINIIGHPDIKGTAKCEGLNNLIATGVESQTVEGGIGTVHSNYSYATYEEDYSGTPICSSRETYSVKGNLGFIQVRYQEQPFEYDTGEVDINDDPIFGEIDVVHSVGLAKGISPVPGTTPNYMYLTLVLSTYYVDDDQAFSNEFVKTGYGNPDEWVGHANMSTDKSKVYFVYTSAHPMARPTTLYYPTYTSSIYCETYVFEIDPDTMQGEWKLDNSDVFVTTGYYVNELFVSPDGVVKGLWNCFDGSTAIEFEFAEMDFFTGATTVINYCCLGPTVNDGNFDWYKYSRTDEFIQTTSEYENNFDDESAVTRSDIPPCDIPECEDECKPGGSGVCGEYQSYTHSGDYWCTKDLNVNYPLNLGAGTTGIIEETYLLEFDGGQNVGSGEQHYRDVRSLRVESSVVFSAEYRCTNSCPAGDPGCNSVDGTITYDYEKSLDVRSDILSANVGVANLTMISESLQLDYYSSEDINPQDICGHSVDDEFISVCGCQLTPGAGYVRVNQILNVCPNIDIGVDYFDCDDDGATCTENENQYKKVLHPVVINDALGEKGFIIHDQNSNTTYAGVMYRHVNGELQSGDQAWTIVKNGSDITAEVFNCTGYSVDGDHPFDYMAYRW